MARLKHVFPLLALILAACQTPQSAPSTQDTLSPASTAEPVTSPSPSVTTKPATPSPNQFLTTAITGKIYDEQGMPLDGATVQVECDQYPNLNATYTAFGGAYGILDVPENAVVTVKATKAGYTLRERKVKATILPEGSDEVPNRLDFGGLGKGMLYALSRYPEIASVTPVNKATGVLANPLKIVLTLSHSLKDLDRNRFAGLLEVRFQAKGETQIIRQGTAYLDRAARIDWDGSGKVATFTFDAPLVTGGPDGAAVTVGLDQTVAIENLPKSTDSYRLGMGQSVETTEGTGAGARNQVAVFARQEFPSPAPSTRPSPQVFWGLTHHTTVAFSLATDKTPPGVERVSTISDAKGDRFVVTFTKPMRGFPEKAIDRSVFLPSNYRYVLGNTEKKADKQNFEEADPRKGGSSSDEAPYFSGESDRTVVVPVSAGTFSRYTNFKFYIAPDVKDIEGNALPEGGVVMEGNVK